MKKRVQKFHTQYQSRVSYSKLPAVMDLLNVKGAARKFEYDAIPLTFAVAISFSFSTFLWEMGIYHMNRVSRKKGFYIFHGDIHQFFPCLKGAPGNMRCNTDIVSP